MNKSESTVHKELKKIIIYEHNDQAGKWLIRKRNKSFDQTREYNKQKDLLIKVIRKDIREKRIRKYSIGDNLQ